MSRFLQLTLASLVLLPGCNLPLPTGEHSINPNPNAWTMGGAPEDQVLYGRDGSPVGAAVPQGGPGGIGQAPGPVQISEGPLNHGPEIDETQGSRVVMLDLYQQAVKDRERLMEEVAWAQDELDKAYGIIQAHEANAEDHASQLEEASAANAQLESQVFELAERLATAQLRRLEAEKLLLEKTLEQTRAQQEANQ